MISEDVAICIVYLVHTRSVYLLFMADLSVEGISMQIKFATFRGQ